VPFGQSFPHPFQTKRMGHPPPARLVDGCQFLGYYRCPQGAIRVGLALSPGKWPVCGGGVAVFRSFLAEVE